MDEPLNRPPHSAEAEQSVLGAAMLGETVAQELAGLISSADFYDPQHRGIFSTICALAERSQLVDIITVHEAGGHDLAYLNSLAQSVPSARGAQAYARIVREHAQRRELMQMASRQREEAMAAMLSVPELIDRAVTSLLAMMQGTREDEPRAMHEVVAQYLGDLEARASGKTDAISTGLMDLDHLTGGGGRPGELWVIGARPSMGKSAFALHLARHVGAAANVLLLSMEDSLMSVTARHVAAAGRVNLADLRAPQHAPESMWGAVADAADDLVKLRVFMDEQPALTIGDARRKVQQVTAKHGKPALILVDYLQMMDGEGQSRNEQIGRLAYQLQALGKESGAWVVLLSQLTREADKRSGPPQMADLRDSGDIEGAARFIGMLYREFVRKPSHENKHWAQLHVCKQNNGPTATLDLYFDGQFQRFGNWSGAVPFSHAQGGE